MSDDPVPDAMATPKPWNIIIVNQIPLGVDREKFISVFEHYGKIESIYLSRKPTYEEISKFGKWTNGSYTNERQFWYVSRKEETAQITFYREEDARRVLKDSRKKLITYNGSTLMITLATPGYSPLARLDDNSLLHIFSYLTNMPDRFRLEGVSTRWKQFGLKSWAFMRSIDARDCAGVHTLRMISDRIGESVRNLSIRFNDSYTEPREIIAKCPKLRVVIFDLETVAQRDCGILLNELPRSLIGITLFGSFPEIAYVVTPVDLSRYPNLQILKLRYITAPQNHLLGWESVPNLTVLELDRDIHHSTFRNLASLSKLEDLALTDCEISDSALSSILRNNNRLKFLHISCSQNITDSPLEWIQKLPQLQILSLIGLSHITDRSLHNIAKSVRSVSCYGCDLITDEAIHRLLSYASELEQLSISGPLVSTKSVQRARAWVIRNGKPLHLNVADDVFRDIGKMKLPPIEGFTISPFTFSIV